MPAVSTRRKRMPSATKHSSIVSRVVPATSDTMARCSPIMALSSVLLPEFGASPARVHAVTVSGGEAEPVLFVGEKNT